MTDKIYYRDAYLTEFSANVLSCEPDGDRFRAILDRTAFYPEGGGQRADFGTIGDARVLDVKKKDGEVIHILDREISGEVKCAVDFAPRYRMMQNHTAEHILCGAFHRLIGAENVGFHMGAKDVTFDLDREADDDVIARAEYEANEAVFRNLEVRSFFPSDDELSRLAFRSKGEFAPGAAIRIVEIGDADRCACSALHVGRTGEIGRIKLISHARYKGGMRFHMLAGYDALEYDLAEHSAVLGVARRLSAKPEELPEAVALLEEKIAADKEARKLLVSRYSNVLAAHAVNSRAIFENQGESARSLECSDDVKEKIFKDDPKFASCAVAIGENALIADDLLAADELREVANTGTTRGFCHTLAINAAIGNFVMTAGDGCDAAGFLAKLKEKIPISGGGKREMVSGRTSAGLTEVAAALGEIAKEQQTVGR